MNNAARPDLDLDEYNWTIVHEILQTHIPQCTVWAFGSRVKGTAKTYSDLDLAIIGDQPLPFSLYTTLKDAFDESDMTIKVDIVDWATTSESFRKIIEHDKVIVQSK